MLRLRDEVQHGSAELDHLRKLVTLCAEALAGTAEQKEVLAAELAVQQQVRAGVEAELTEAVGQKVGGPVCRGFSMPNSMPARGALSERLVPA